MALASQVAGAFSDGIVVIDVLGVLLWMKSFGSLLLSRIVFLNFVNWSQGEARGGRASLRRAATVLTS